MKDLYFVSGLGADARVFQFLKFEGYQPKHIYWIPPEPQESIEQYAKRLTQQIQSDRPILVGLSFGGMMAIEIAKWLPTEKIILISSAKNRLEIPGYIQLLKLLPLHKWVSIQLLNWAGLGFMNWFFGVTTQAESQLLKAILLETDSTFLRWAIDRVLDWQNIVIPANLHHIHGTDDRVLPLRYAKADTIVEGGGHFMIVSKAAQISQLLEHAIQGNSP